MPLAQAVNDAAGRAALESLRAEANKLKALFAGPVPQSLKLPLGFNSLDGD
jgi:predicted lipoprotein